jgi:hypothetical protein
MWPWSLNALVYHRSVQDSPDTREQYNLAPSATPCAVYGVLSLLLCWVPLLSLILALMGLLRGHRAGVELRAEPRFQGQRLISLGLWLSIVGVALGILAVVYWVDVLVRWVADT